jgi:hypothetical protein
MVRRTILCAGHGGGDSGAVARGTTEAAQTVDIVNRTADKLRADGQVEVVVVPHELGLVDSINWVNAHYKNLEDGYALEVHKNAGGGTGTEMWYFGGDAESSRLASLVAGPLAQHSGLVNRGVKPDTANRHGRLGWVRDTNPWAGLAEVGFIDVDHLDNAKYAEGVFRGVLNLWGLTPKPVAPVVVPPTAEVNFRVFAGTKQIGAYKTESSAWNKYSTEGGTKIVDKNGADVTPQFVAKFRPPVPTQPAPPHPEVKPIETRLDAIELWIKTWGAKLELLYQYIFRYKRFKDFLKKENKDG